MRYQEQEIRIKRMLRDPDGKIWSEGDILRAYNMSQQEFVDITGNLENVAAIKIPPQFYMSYMWDWEWHYAKGEDDSKHVYQCGKQHMQSDYVCCYQWEIEHLANGAETTVEIGTMCMHPWEGWTSVTPNRVPPLYAPHDFHEMVGLYYDRDPIDPSTRKDVMLRDITWESRVGEPQMYYRDEELENWLYLYPIPSSVTWNDVVTQNEEAMVLFRNDGDDDDTVTDSIDYGGIIDYSESIGTDTDGIVFDITDFEENLLMIYRLLPSDMSGDGGDESDYPPFIRKYVEYGALERLYRMNTDGKIQSLADYWGYRKGIAFEAIKRFRSKRVGDREYRLRTKGAPAMRSRAHPRLPASYPAVYP